MLVAEDETQLPQKKKESGKQSLAGQKSVNCARSRRMPVSNASIIFCLLPTYCLQHDNLTRIVPGVSATRRSVRRSSAPRRALMGTLKNRNFEMPPYPTGHFGTALAISSAPPPQPDRDRVHASPPGLSAGIGPSACADQL